MKSTVYKLFMLMFSAFSGPFLLAQGNGGNYIRKTIYAESGRIDKTREEVSFFDGLGRPRQTLQIKASGDTLLSMVDLTEYDANGRPMRQWLPVPISWDGLFIPVPVASIKAFSHEDADTCAFTLTEYDGSPLDRIRKVIGPGQAWHAVRKGVTSGYLTNAGANGDKALQCRKYGFTLSGNTGISFAFDDLYPAGTLTVERTEDEDGRTLWVFKDMLDQTVLERRLVEVENGNTSAIYADTYYLYDGTGHLMAVLPPELSKYFSGSNWSGSTETDPKVEGYAYQYRYDVHGRMIAKKLPGAAWTYFVYDKGDRLVLTQDGNQRERGEWSFRMQDMLGHECLTGVLTGSYDPFSNPLNAVQVYAVRDRNANDYSLLHGYTVNGITLPAEYEVLTVNWWDDYSFLDGQDGMNGTDYQYLAPSGSEVYGECYEASAQGLQTGRWSTILGEIPDEWAEGEPSVREVWYYDDHGRTVYHVKGYPSGKRVVERSGYDFVGNLTALGRTMYGADETSHSETIAYTYDNWGRPLETTSTLDDGSDITLASNSYDTIGRLSSVTRGGTASQNAPSALTGTFSYNVRNWLTEIGGSLFTEKLIYETSRAGGTLPGQWGGNISSSTWKTSLAPSDSTWYDYRYDALGRLIQARYGSSSASQRDHSRTYSYDLNGNMETRIIPDRAWNDISEERENHWAWSQMNGNRPDRWEQKLYKKTTLPPLHPWQPPRVIMELDPFGQAEESYTYDAVGNRTAVLDAQGDTLSVMHYNLLNLPEEFLTVDGDTVKYVYSADGVKLYMNETPAEGSVKGTEYVANYRIENNTLKMVHTDAGYYTPVMTPFGATGPVYAHIWYLKDHLGNNRILADEGGNAIAANDYDPFGDEISVVSTSLPYPFPPGGSESPYKFGGKEWSEITSTYNFEARQFSPKSHRFMTMDPMSEKYYGISPYAYCAGNPVNIVDPNGMDYWILNRDGRIVNVLSSETTCMLFAVETSECYQDGTDTIFRQLAFNSHERIEDNEKFKVSFASNLSGNDALSLFKFLSDNTNVEWAMHGTTEFTIGTTHNKSSCGEWSWYGLDSRPKFSIHSHPGDKYTTDYEQRYSAGNDWRAMQNNPESKAKYYYIYFPVTETYSQLKLDYMYPMGPLPSVFNKIKKR